MKKLKPSYIVGGNIAHFEKWFVVSKKVKQLPYDPETPLIGILSRKIKTYVHTKTCAQMLIVAFFIMFLKGRNNQEAHQVMNR